MPWVIKSIISSLSGFRRLFSRLGLDLLTSQSGTRLIRDKFFVQETSSPPTVIKGKCSLEKEPALQILLHSPSRGWLTAQLAFFADEQLFSSLQVLWPLGLSCLCRTVQAERGGCAGWTRAAGSRGGSVLCSVLIFVHYVQQMNIPQCQIQPIAGFTLYLQEPSWDF